LNADAAGYVAKAEQRALSGPVNRRSPVSFPENAGIVVPWIDRLIRDVVASPRFSTEAMRQDVAARGE
jgi:hypothetical protein